MSERTTCLIPVWDGPYRMQCGMGISGTCFHHGKHRPHPEGGCVVQLDGYCTTHGLYREVVE